MSTYIVWKTGNNMERAVASESVNVQNKRVQRCRYCACGQRVRRDKWHEHLSSEGHLTFMHQIKIQKGVERFTCGSHGFSVNITNFDPETITLGQLISLFGRFGRIINGFLSPDKTSATLFFNSRSAVFKAVSSNKVNIENKQRTDENSSLDPADVKPPQRSRAGRKRTQAWQQKAKQLERKEKQRGLSDDSLPIPNFQGLSLYGKEPESVTSSLPSPLPKADGEAASTDESWEQQARNLMKDLGVPLEPAVIEEDASISNVQNDLQTALETVFDTCEIYVFGSRKTGMATKISDADIFVDLSNSEYMKSVDMEKLKENKKNLKTFRENTFKLCVTCVKQCGCFKNILGIAKARVPIIKCTHKKTGLKLDISFKNLLSVWNSVLIKYYIDLDERVRYLVFIIRYWLRSLSLHRSMTCYSLSMMLFSYLQSLPEPIIPSLQELLSVDAQNIYADGWHCSFEPIPFTTSNTQNIQELLQGFFAYLTNFDFGVDVLCCMNGSAVPKWRFLHPDFLPEDQSALKQLMLRDESLAFRVKSLPALCMQDVMELNHCTTKRMKQKQLTQLRQLCSAASEYCARDSATLQGLVSLEMMPLYPSNIVVLEFTKFFPPMKDLNTGVNIKLCWLEKVVSIIGQVFHHIFHLTFVKKPEIPEIQINGETQIWSLVSKYCLWENRENGPVAKSSKLTFQSEIKSSQKLIQKVKDENEVKVNVNVKLTSPPTRIQLEIVTESEREKLLQYLQLNLQNLVEKGLVEDYSKVKIISEKINKETAPMSKLCQ